VFIGRYMYSEEHEEDDFVFDNACCKQAGTTSPATCNVAVMRVTAVAHQDSSASAPPPRAAEGSTCVSQPTLSPPPPPPMLYSVA
jgi:hypothetical protein